MFVSLSDKFLSIKSLWLGKSNNQRASRACSCYTGVEELSGTEKLKTKDMFNNYHSFLNGGAHHTGLHSGHGKVNTPCSGRKRRWKYTDILVLLVVLLLYSNISLANNYCGRKIISGKQGVVSDGPGFYPNRRSCEWLIKGTPLSILHHYYSCRYFHKLHHHQPLLL